VELVEVAEEATAAVAWAADVWAAVVGLEATEVASGDTRRYRPRECPRAPQRAAKVL